MKLKHLTSSTLNYISGPEQGQPISFVACEVCIGPLVGNGDVIRDATPEDAKPGNYFGEFPPVCSYCGDEDPDLTARWMDGRQP